MIKKLILMGLLILIGAGIGLTGAAAAEESGVTTPSPIELIPGTNDSENVIWEGAAETGWNLTVSGNDKSYILTQDIKVNKIDITANNINVDGNDKIITATDTPRYSGIILIKGDAATLTRLNADFSNVTAPGTETGRKSMQAVVISGNDTNISDSTLKTGKSEGSSSQVIVVTGKNTTIKNNVLVAESASTNPNYSGSVAVRAHGNADNIIVIDNTINCTSAETSRNSGIGLDGVATATLALTVKNNTFNLANTESNPNCAAIYISPGSAEPVINLTTDNKNKAGQGSSFSYIYIDKAGNSGLTSVTLTSPAGAAVYGLEGKAFLNYEEGLKAIFKDLTVANGFGGEISKKIMTEGNVSLNNLTFTDEIRMIESKDNLTVTNSVFGKTGHIQLHGVYSVPAAPLTALTLDNNVFEGSFRKGALIFANGSSASPVVIKKNVFNGTGWNWTDDPVNNTDKVNKTSAMTIVAGDSTTVTMADNIFEDYYKILSVDHSTANGNWTIDNNTFKNVAYAMDINGSQTTYRYNMTYSFFTDAAGQSGTILKVLDSSSETPAEYEIPESDSIVNVYPYYLDAGRKNVQKNASTNESVKDLVNDTLKNITDLPDVAPDTILNSTQKQAVSDAVNETKQLPISSLKTEMSTPSGLNTIQKLDELQKVANNITVEKPQGVTVVGAALSANLDETVGITVNNVELTDYPALPEIPNSVVSVVIDIQMTVDDNVISDLAAPIHITMEIPDGIDRTKPVIVTHYRGGTTPEDIPATVSGTKMSFIVTGFSPFVITNGAASGGSGGSGGSGTGSATVREAGGLKAPQEENKTTPPTDNQSNITQNGSTDSNDSVPDEKQPVSNVKWILLVGAGVVILAAAFFLYRRNK